MEHTREDFDETRGLHVKIIGYHLYIKGLADNVLSIGTPDITAGYLLAFFQASDILPHFVDPSRNFMAKTCRETNILGLSSSSESLKIRTADSHILDFDP
jgi:hypothetical protein